MESLYKWFRKAYNKSVHSVAFFPALFVAGFVGLAIVTMELDASGAGKALNEKIKWLTLKDASAARTIAATIAAGIISLMVFSFSMVMVVLNQAASQMSNRMLDNLIGDKFQKLVLSFYIGTIIYAFLLLSNISEATNRTVPVLSIYVLIILTIIDIFLFVTFLHYITESIRYEQLIQAIHGKAQKSLTAFATEKKATTEKINPEGREILSKETGYFQGFSTERLLRICAKEDIAIRFLQLPGEYVVKNTPLFILCTQREINGDVLEDIFLAIDFYYGQEIDKNPYYGFKHLMEVGVKALSPGINDPGTAVLSLHALTDLLAYKMHHAIPSVFCDEKGTPRIITRTLSFVELFERSVLPVWDYGKNDRLVQSAMLRMIGQLQLLDSDKRYAALFSRFAQEVEDARKTLFHLGTETYQIR